jgi:hypothetical protein
MKSLLLAATAVVFATSVKPFPGLGRDASCSDASGHRDGNPSLRMAAPLRQESAVRRALGIGAIAAEILSPARTRRILPLRRVAGSAATRAAANPNTMF